MSNEFYRVAAACPAVNVADCATNADNIISMTRELAAQGVKMIVFPEMSITGYTCGDLFHSRALLDGALAALARVAEATAGLDVIAWVGLPLLRGNDLYNCAVAVNAGKILAVVPKTYLPSYDEFYEKRWFRSGINTTGTIDLGEELGVVPFGTDILVRSTLGVTCGVDVCEDLWVPMPPSTLAALGGANVIVNLSASNDVVGKRDYLMRLIEQQSAHCVAGYVYSAAGFGESTTDLVFDGKCFVAENGVMLEASTPWLRDPHSAVADIDLRALEHDRIHHTTFGDCAHRLVIPEFRIISVNQAVGESNNEIKHPFSAHPFIPEVDFERHAAEIVNILVAGLSRRLSFTGCRSAVIGISGGLDSTLALLITVRAFDSLGLDRKGIVGVTMPGFGTTGRTHSNAVTLMERLGITMREISIVKAVTGHFADIGHDPAVHDVTYENSQARERTQLLMDIANQTGGMVIGTGDMSELALGWATYNGDHMSMYGVNAGVPKTLVGRLVSWLASVTPDATEAEALRDIVDTPISPELIPADEHGDIAQKTEDLVGPYELHDFFIYHTLRHGRSPRQIFNLARQVFNGEYDDATIKHWLRTFTRRFFNQQFKRSCLPDGPKVTVTGLSPRGDWRMPSDASSRLWLSEIEKL